MRSESTEEIASVTKTLSRFVAGHGRGDLPARVEHEAKRALMNFFAVAMAGCRDDAVAILFDTLGEFSGVRQATIIGRPERGDLLLAALINAASANVFDFDDTHQPTIIHPTAPVAPALFALSERMKISGADLLHAFALGVEVECRIGNSVSPGHYSRGWHITSTCGTFGAAAAAAKIIGLDAGQLAAAFGIASAQSAGLVETLGTMAKSVSVGNAARGGLLAALLAQRGFTGPERPIEGVRGFAHVMGEAPDLAQIVTGLGAHWELERNTYKPFPCGVVLNPVIEACLELYGGPDFHADDIVEIVVTGNPLLRQRTDRPAIARGREAQVSAQHAIGAVLLRGKAGLAEFNDDAVADERIRALVGKVVMKDDAAMAVDAAALVLTMRKGDDLTAFVPQAWGSLARPMTDGQIEAKLRTLAATNCPGCDVDRLIDAIWTLDRNADASSILSLTHP